MCFFPRQHARLDTIVTTPPTTVAIVSHGGEEFHVRTRRNKGLQPASAARGDTDGTTARRNSQQLHDVTRGQLHHDAVVLDGTPDSSASYTNGATVDANHMLKCRCDQLDEKSLPDDCKFSIDGKCNVICVDA
jgi:hypothetical protein